MPAKLSICIPTYNRAPLLNELLTSIADQYSEQVQVAISDNASTDDTASLVETFRSRIAHLDYHRNETNIGPDRNYMMASSLARGEYCLLMGSDDVVAPGGISRILEYLQSDPDILIYNRMDCTFAMKPFRLMQPARFATNPVQLRIENDTDLIAYLDQCESIGMAYSYLSMVVIRLDRWKSVACRDVLIGSAYPHVGVFLDILSVGATLTYTSEPLVLNRGGNDSFNQGGATKRVVLDLDGYNLLARTIFSEKPALAAALRRLVAREHTRWYMRAFTVFLPRKLRMGRDGWHEVNQKLRELGGTPCLRYRLFEAITGNWVFWPPARKAVMVLHGIAKSLLR